MTQPGSARSGRGEQAAAPRTILSLKEVTRDYGAGVKIGPVSCDVAEGEFISLLGPSGCGKTTLLRSIAGFEPVSGGKIQIEGRDVANQPPHKRAVGFVFQNFALFPHMSVFDNVGFGLRLRKIAKRTIAERVERALQTVGLNHLASRLPGQLSGGQQQRVAIARSIVLEPAIMLLDEPLSSLDLKLRVQMRQELRSLQRKLGTTFIYVTHDQTEALALSDRIVILSDGKIAQAGTPAQIYHRPQTRFVADFVGASNLIEVTQVQSTSARTAVELVTGDHVDLGAAERPTGSGSLCLCIRPEAMTLLEDGAEPGQDRHVLSGEVVASTFSGERTELTVELGRVGERGHTTILVYASRPRSGRVSVAFDPASAVLLSD